MTVDRRDVKWWIIILDRYGPSTMVMVFIGAAMWFSGSWAATRLVEPTIAAHMQFVKSLTKSSESQAKSIKLMQSVQQQQLKLLAEISENTADWPEKNYKLLEQQSSMIEQAVIKQTETLEAIRDLENTVKAGDHEGM